MSRFAAALVLLSCVAAPAGARERVVVSSFRIVGETLGEPARATLRASALGALQSAGFDPIPDEEVARAAAPDLSGCGTPSCLRRIAERLGARRMADVEVKLVGTSNYVVTLGLLDASDWHTVAHSQEKCEVCNQREALETINAAAAALQRQLSGETSPTLPMPTTATTTLSSGAPPPRTLAAAGIACAALGVAALAAGIPLLVLDGDEVARHVDATGHFVLERYHTVGPGAAFTAVGAGMAVAAAVLFWRDRAERTVALTPAFGPHSTALVLDARF